MDRATTPSFRVLVIDDDEGVRNFVSRGLTRVGFSTVAADGGGSGIAQLSSHTFDAVVCDLNMPEIDGLEVLRFAASLSPRPVFLVLTGFGSINVAVEAMKRGAADFIEKPVTIEALRAAILTALNKPTPEKSVPKGLIGSPEWLDDFLVSLRRIAQRDSNALIEGETGTGKSAVAREIWRQSARAKKPFVEMNCAAIPDNLMESELFGHKKGSFSGAVADYVGRVEQASGGTLFLDEIGELKMELQAKLLHLVQEKTFSPIGGKPLQADVRFIAATNKKLEIESDAGRFRSDLYYRLNVVGLWIPPLRERPNDIPLLVDYFRSVLKERTPDEPPPEFSPDTLDVMKRYSWRGNVRELENFVERMAVMHPSKVILPLHLPPRMREEAGVSTSRHETPLLTLPLTPVPVPTPTPPQLTPNLPLNEDLRAREIARITEALKTSDWNKSKASRQLGIKRTTLIEKLKKYGIKEPVKDEGEVKEPDDEEPSADS